MSYALFVLLPDNADSGAISAHEPVCRTIVYVMGDLIIKKIGEKWGKVGESAVLLIICKIYLYILRYLYFHVFVKLNRTLSALIIYIY